MGNLQASEMAHSGLPLRAQLHWHLTANHFPSLPASMVDVAEEAINRINAGETIDDVTIDLPEGITFRGRESMTLAEALTSLHLDAWVENEEDW